VRLGAKKRQNSASLANFAGWLKMGPRPPTRKTAQASSAAPMTSRTGAAHASKNRIDSVPWTMK
jgi:hypothetical protein